MEGRTVSTFSIEAAPTSTTPSSTTFPTKLRISFVLLASILFGLTTTVRGSLFFWFCRTLIRCDVENGNYTNTTNTTNLHTNNNTDPLWSGKLFSQNKKIFLFLFLVFVLYHEKYIYTLSTILHIYETIFIGLLFSTFFFLLLFFWNTRQVHPSAMTMSMLPRRHNF